MTSDTRSGEKVTAGIKGKDARLRSGNSVKSSTLLRSGLRVRGSVKAGGLAGNHARNALSVNASSAASGLKVRAGVRAGEIVQPNHSVRGLRLV